MCKLRAMYIIHCNKALDCTNHYISRFPFLYFLFLVALEVVFAPLHRCKPLLLSTKYKKNHKDKKNYFSVIILDLTLFYLSVNGWYTYL